ncbi:hypothetical protein ACFXJ8_10075 [Nonomuraea sp. NPDC059194]|uniref:hypothetical protein n=1 Tax=Nonomuraea sp. NPDC059194 TaxID=3346764 RepID=UPI0036760CF6
MADNLNQEDQWLRTAEVEVPSPGVEMGVGEELDCVGRHIAEVTDKYMAVVHESPLLRPMEVEAPSPGVEKGVAEELDCVGRHIAEVADKHKRIHWSPSAPRATRVRVRAHTCSCAPVSYELCQAAGLMFIRRTSRAKGVTVVHESPWLRTAQVEALWQSLLRGEAR